jgi:hypothetical protein
MLEAVGDLSIGHLVEDAWDVARQSLYGGQLIAFGCFRCVDLSRCLPSHSRLVKGRSQMHHQRLQQALAGPEIA